MGSFTCCVWWLVFGVLLGWLLSWWLGKYLGNKTYESLIADEKTKPDETPSLRQTYFNNTPSTPEVASPEISRADMIRAASAAGISFSGKKNDLEIIEGIGPKIAELLNENGIHTFAELSEASFATLNLILEQGGERFKLANPNTWAEQALLAAENNWPELKALQDALDGGIKKS
jgi:predicted flap endonuclease-1-like 5' DNA nuclease